MVVNIWSKYNTEQFPAQYTRGDLTFLSHLDTVETLHFLFKCGIKSLKLRNWKVCMNQSLPGLGQTVILRKNSVLQIDFWTCLSLAALLFHQAKKTTKMMKKTTRTRKILIISQRLEETDWKYLRISMCAASTFSWVSSTFASILEQSEKAGSTTFGSPNYCSLLLITVAIFQCTKSSKSF